MHLIGHTDVPGQSPHICPGYLLIHAPKGRQGLGIQGEHMDITENP